MSETMNNIFKQYSKEKGNLIPMLRRVQEADGCLNLETIAEISRYLDLSQNYVYSVASSYREFCFTRPE